MKTNPGSALRRREWAVISEDAVMMELTYEEGRRLVDENAAGQHCATVVTNVAAERLLLSRNQ